MSWARPEISARGKHPARNDSAQPSPEQAKTKGIPYGELVERLIAAAAAMSARTSVAGPLPRRQRGARRSRCRRRSPASPVTQARANGGWLVLRRLRACSAVVVILALDIPARRERQPLRRIGRAGFTISATRSSASPYEPRAGRRGDHRQLAAPPTKLEATKRRRLWSTLERSVTGSPLRLGRGARVLRRFQHARRRHRRARPAAVAKSGPARADRQRGVVLDHVPVDKCPICRC